MQSVTVIIPTILREALGTAIRSALAQEGVITRVVVVVDGPPQATDPLPAAGAHVILYTGGGKGAGYARNMGIAAAETEFVAFLDDDDAWQPEKLVDQLRLYSASGTKKLVLGGRIVHRQTPEDPPALPVPTHLVSPGRIEDYLFLKRVPGMGRASFHTSTILLATEFAKEVPWDPELPRHQDWDWLVRLQAAGAAFKQSAAPNTVYLLSAQGSISSNSKWEPSLDWVRRHRHTWRSQTYVDFLVAQPLRYAFLSRSLRGVREVTSEILRAKRLPHVGPIMIGLAGLVPRKTAIKLASSLSSAKKK